jgi:hypothetical protein
MVSKKLKRSDFEIVEYLQYFEESKYTKWLSILFINLTVRKCKHASCASLKAGMDNTSVGNKSAMAEKKELQ